jgi:sulfur relay (sulfurtransferase) complex TusBCD TusD component (DsrE family)
MDLKEIVRVDETALVANAVNFNFMKNANKNYRLCQGFVFNYDPNIPTNSTVGILDRVWRSFHSQRYPNIHLMVQDFGKGKSHFALVIANFFQKKYESQEVQTILEKVQNATGQDAAILESLKNYKQRGRHLVVCIDGVRTTDLRKTLLEALKDSLEEEGITNSIAHRLCQNPLTYLENLDSDKRRQANNFLEDRNYEDDVEGLIERLQNNDYKAISIVKNISGQLEPYPYDFEANVDVEAILTEIIQNFCSGQNAYFQGILILFDELYYYLQRWSTDVEAAGGMTLQNITNICENYSNNIALLSFSQLSLQQYNPEKNTEDYRKLASRLERQDSTYEPISSLELVVDSLIVQNNWQNYYEKWEDTFLEINKNIYQNRIANYYQSRNWNIEDFLRHITKGCFPLYPLTAYLLCTLDFTQGRTAIQFVQDDVSKFIQKQPAEQHGRPNWMYPITLVDAFENNFANSDYSIYDNYEQAWETIAASATEEEKNVLKALFLYYASMKNAKIAKSDNEEHEKLLELLTGMSQKQLRVSVDKLCNERGVIYYNPGDKTYRFFSGGWDINTLRKEIEREASKETPSLEDVKEHFQANRINYSIERNLVPKDFIAKHTLVDENWKFKCDFYTKNDIKRVIEGYREWKETLGIIAYVIVQTDDEIGEFAAQIQELLSGRDSDKKPGKNRTAVAIASKGAEELARLLTVQKVAKSKKVKDYGEALKQLQLQLEKEIERQAWDLFQSCTFYSRVSEQMSEADRYKPDRVASQLLNSLYSDVPPVNGIDKFKLSSTAGEEIIGFVANRLLEDRLFPSDFPKQSYKPVVEVFEKIWGVLQLKDQKYIVIPPTKTEIQKAWNKISKLTELQEEKDEQIVDIKQIWETLSVPPYGYNKLTFTALFAAWLNYHRSEVEIKGNFGIAKKKSEDIPIRRRPISEWSTKTNVFNKPKDFIEWIKKGNGQIIRRKKLPLPEIPTCLNYQEAKQKVQDISNFLYQNPNTDSREELNYKYKQLENAFREIEKKFKVVEKAEKIVSSKQFSLQKAIQPYKELQIPLKEVIKENLSVEPTEQQKQQYSQMSTRLLQCIGNEINNLYDRASQLETVEECSQHRTRIEQALENIQEAKDHLPERFLQILQSARQITDEQQEESKVRDRLKQIENAYNRLGTLATQEEYNQTYSEIEKIAEALPQIRDRATYKEILNSIHRKQEELLQQLEQWESDCNQTLSKTEATKLQGEINRQYSRFTEPYYQEQLNRLLQQVEEKIRFLEEQEKQEQQREKARAWLEDLKTEFQRVETNNPDDNDIQKTIELSNNITQKRTFYESFFSEEEKQTLNHICNRCEEIQNQNIETKILSMFEQLSYERRQQLLHKLNSRLS